MALQALDKNQLPAEISQKIRTDETVYYFSRPILPRKGDSLKKADQNQWLLITNEKVLYRATVRSIDTQMFGSTDFEYSVRSGSVPIAKNTTTEVQTDKFLLGGGFLDILSAKFIDIGILSIGSVGGKCQISIPSIEEANNIQSIMDQVVAEKD
jgi:hypothetical protein